MYPKIVPSLLSSRDVLFHFIERSDRILKSIVRCQSNIKLLFSILVKILRKSLLSRWFERVSIE